MTERPARVLALVDLVQDLDVLAPVLLALHADPRFALRTFVSRWLAVRAPRVPRRLKGGGIAFAYVDRTRLLAGDAPTLEGIDLVLTASESTAGPHRWAHALVNRAREAGIPTATLQHGLDNLERLTGPPHRRLGFASDQLFCWPPETGLPVDLAARDRARIVSVGRAVLPADMIAPAFDIGIFESLHARGYTDDQRAMVLAHILGLALARPHLSIYVQTHPAGGWLDGAADRLAVAGRITFVDSAASRRADAPARDAVARAARIIVTPSTVALDAAQSGRPVALAFDGGPLYAPLPVLERLEDWIAYADRPPDAGPDQQTFLARHVAPGDAVAHILAHLAGAEGKSRARPQVSQ